MGAGKERLELKIDVLNTPAQRALALADLTTEELIAATLQEFTEIEYLGLEPGDYRLLDAASGAELTALQPIHAQVHNNDTVRLVEREKPVPAGASRPPASLYLRELASGRVFKLHWLPAIIGRTDRNLPDNQLLAANLETLPAGLRVSRRHAQISQQNGQYFIQCLSGNPVTLRRAGGESLPIGRSHHPIAGGDQIVLDRSGIVLKFIVLDGEAVPPAAHESGSEIASMPPGGEAEHINGASNQEGARS